LSGKDNPNYPKPDLFYIILVHSYDFLLLIINEYCWGIDQLTTTCQVIVCGT